VGLINRFHAVSARMARINDAPCVRREPVLSLTFDDFPKSAWTTGGPILAEYGARATYYVAGRFCGAVEDGQRYFDRDDLTAIDAAGHEIGCHTFSHLQSRDLSTAQFHADRQRNQRFLAEVLPGRVFDSFAYPYGNVSVRVKRAAARSSVTARGLRPAVNGDRLDLALLTAAPMERRSWREAAFERLARRAADTGGWLILFSHDVSDQPSPYGCTPAMLESVLASARRLGLATLPVGEAARRRAGI